jgi:phosphoadenosine phosphosulfate reductase
MSLDTLWGNKVDIAIERLRMFEPEEGYYLAFSGGKDSQCIYHLAVAAGVRFDAHFSVTTVDPPELLRFIRENYPDVHWERPEKSMFRLIVQNGMPTRLHRFCCRALKENGGEGRFTVTGVRWAESTRRSKRTMNEACRTGKGKTFLHPIIDWSDADVWSYLDSLGVSHCELYDQGQTRIGCVMCPMKNKQRLTDAERWPRIAHMYRAAAERYWERRMASNNPTQWESGQAVYDWWLSDGHNTGDDDQPMLFE